MSFPQRCIDLAPVHVVRALRKKDAMAALLTHMADIARSAEGAPKILVPIARIATSDCAWFEGGVLEVTVGGNDDMTRVVVEVVRGKAREKLFPKMLLMVPFSEFARAVKLAPRLVHPLKSSPVKQGLLLTSAGLDAAMTEPTPFAVAEAAIRKSLPAPLRRSLPPIADSTPTSVRVDMPSFDEAALLRGALKRQPVPKIEEELDTGWDDEPATTPRELPKVPARASKAPPARTSKAPPPRTSKAPPARTSKAPPARTSKAPPPRAPAKPSKAPPAPRPGPAPFRPPPRPSPGGVPIPRPGARRSIPPPKK